MYTVHTSLIKSGSITTTRAAQSVASGAAQSAAQRAPTGIHTTTNPPVTSLKPNRGIDIPKISQSNLLILKGIYPTDFDAENIWDKPVKVVKKSPPPVYTDIPKEFTSVGEWSRLSSNLKCWNCDLWFTTYPKFIPKDVGVSLDGEPTCEPRGNFCTWNCAVKYIEQEYSADEKWDANEGVLIFEGMFSGVRKEKIMPSPSKTLMQAYSGNRGITPEEYREKIEQLNRDYNFTGFRIEDFKV